MTYPELIKAFEAETLDSTAFRHVDHIGVAFEMLRKYDFVEATYRYSVAIRSIATKAGAEKNSTLRSL
jgi:hypothetical protein